MKLSPKGFALSLGIVWGVLLFLGTNLVILRSDTGEHLAKLAMIYIGYSVSFVGSLVGLVWGFVSLFIIGWIFAWLYNRFSGSAA